MAIKIRRAGATVSATAVDITHTGDSVRLGDGTTLTNVASGGSLYTTLRDSTGDSAMDDANNALRVNIVAGGGGSGGIAYTDDAAYTVATHLVTPVGGIYKSVMDAVDDGDVGAFHMTAKRSLHVNVRDDNGDSVMDNTNDAIRVNVVAGSGGGVSATDDAAFTVGVGSIVPVAAMADETTPDSVDEGDVGVLRMTLDRLLKIQIAGVASGIAVPVTDNSSTLSIDDGAGSITVDGTVAATQSGTWNVGTVTTITNVVHVDDNSGSLTVDNGGTFAVQDSQVLADNAGFTDGTTKVFASGYIYDEVAGTALTENDIAAARINVNRAQVSTLEDGATRGRYATVTASNALKVDASGAAVPVTDNGGSLTVDGTVAATQSGTWNVTNVSGTVSLPTGASTLAEQQTQTTSLQLLDDAVATTAAAITAKGFAISGTDGTNARIIKTDASGELQVDVLTLPALAAGTNNIGDVDVLTLPAIPAGTNVIGKIALVDSVGDSVADDANNAIRVNIVAGAGSGGTAMTDDAAFTVASTSFTPVGGTYKSTLDSVDDGDGGAFAMTATRSMHVTLRDSVGDSAMDDANNALRVNVVAGSSGGPSKVDDAAFTVATDSVAPIGAMADETTPDSVDEGDIGVLRMTLDRLLKIQVAGVASGVAIPVTDNSSTLSIDDGAGSITVDGTVAISGTVAVTDNAGSLTVDNGGTFATQDSQVLADNAGFTDGTSKVWPVGYIYDEVAGTALTENDVAAARVNANRAVVSTIEDGTTRGRRVTVTASNELLVSVNNASIAVTDGAGSLTVDGTVAATQSGTWNITNVSGTVSLPTGASTLAEQQTQTTALQLLDDCVATTASAIPTKGFAISGTDGTNARVLKTDTNGELQVDVLTLPALAAGTNNIGDVDVLTVPANMSVNVNQIAGNTVSTGNGVVGTGVQRVAIASDNSNIPVALQHGVTQASSLSALNAAVTMTTQDAATYGIQVTGTFSATLTFESTIDGTNWYAVKGMPVGGGTVVSTTTSTGQWAVPCQGCHNFRVRVSAYTSGTAVVSVSAKPGLNPQWVAQQTMANSSPVVLASDHGNIAVSQATASSLNAQVVGSVAHDGADSGNPVKIGAVARSSQPTSVASGDRADAYADLKGRLVTTPMVPRELVAMQQTTITSSVTETTIVTAAASTYNDLISLSITNSSSTALIVTLKDSTAGTTRAIYALAANGGIVLNFTTPMPQATANNNWTLTCGTSVASIYVSAMFAKNT